MVFSLRKVNPQANCSLISDKEGALVGERDEGIVPVFHIAVGNIIQIDIDDVSRPPDYARSSEGTDSPFGP